MHACNSSFRKHYTFLTSPIFPFLPIASYFHIYCVLCLLFLLQFKNNIKKHKKSTRKKRVSVFSLPLYPLCTGTAMPILQKLSLTIIASQVILYSVLSGRIGLLPCSVTLKFHSFVYFNFCKHCYH